MFSCILFLVRQVLSKLLPLHLQLFIQLLLLLFQLLQLALFGELLLLAQPVLSARSSSAGFLRLASHLRLRSVLRALPFLTENRLSTSHG